eukprot:m.342365 g.342365  ORF g.342365 m.342365 type:complete len:77 (+) comp16547_c1_seq7:86-316(+)
MLATYQEQSSGTVLHSKRTRGPIFRGPPLQPLADGIVRSGDLCADDYLLADNRGAYSVMDHSGQTLVSQIGSVSLS